MARRVDTRMAVLELLYAFDLGNDNAIIQAKDYFESKKIKNAQQQFGLSLINGVNDNVIEIDAFLQKFIKEWDLDRIGGIEKSILRLATFEILFSNIDKAIAINEALELSKIYGVEKAVKFINGVLDSIAKEVAKGLGKEDGQKL